MRHQPDEDLDFWGDDDPDTQMAIDEAVRIADSSPSPSRRTGLMQPPITPTSGRLNALRDVFSDEQSTSTSRTVTHAPATPSSPLKRLTLSTPASTSGALLNFRETSPSPTPRRLPFPLPETRQQRPQTVDFYKSTQPDRATSDSDEESGEVERMSISRTDLSSVFQSVSPTRSISSNSSYSTPSRKPTLEYGSHRIKAGPSSAVKRNLVSSDSVSSNDLSNQSPSKIRRTNSPDEIPSHTPCTATIDDSQSVSMSVVSSPLAPLAENAPARISTYLISHSRQWQTEMDRRGIAWGVQYEIARGITQGQWEWQDLTGSHLDQLRGCNVDAAPRVAAVMLGHDYRPSSDTTVWTELDREQAAIIESSSCERSAGLYGDWEQAQDWYGGRIIQAARLIKPDTRSPYRIKLEALEYQRSTTRFARFLGSRRILRLSVPQEFVYKDEKDVKNFLGQKFILCGRVFLPLRPKDGKVYLVEVQEDFERVSNSDEGDHRRLTFQEIIAWHNPMDYNVDQPVRKWISRFDLGFSISIPVLEFGLAQIMYIDDEYVPTYNPDKGKASAEQIVTDGCGFMNRSALSKIAKHMNYDHIPTAVQGRIAGAKGLWILHPQHQDDLQEEPLIWIRKSQNKIKFCPDNLTRAHLIFDLVAPDRLTFPSRLSMQTILNLSHNGVPEWIFKQLMSSGLKDEFEKLTTWQGHNAMKIVLHAVAKAGNVAGVRLQREAGGMARALGHGRNRDLDETVDLEVNYSDDTETPLHGRAPFSLEPNMLGEKIFEMITAGFHPLQSHTLYSGLHQLVKTLITGYVKSYHIPNPQSCEAFIIPDPFGILEENEIYFRAWQCIRDAQAECDPETIFGPVLINRNPTRLPSDVQLVIAVMDHAGVFQNYRNVIVCSTKGERSFASKLAGGDYDGDTAMITWMPEIVDAFKTPVFSEQPERFMENNFQKDVETVKDFKRRLSSMTDPAMAEQEFQRVLLLGLSDSKIGLYSRLHDNAIYKHGYANPETTRLAYMFNTILDSSKSGLNVLPPVLQHDRRNYDRPPPDCMLKLEKHTSYDNSVAFRRNNSMGHFILDALCEHGRLIESELLTKYDHLTKPSDRVDPYIQREYLKLKEVTFLHQELIMIENHVDNVHQSWVKLWRSNSSPQEALSSPSRRSRANKKVREKDYNAVRREFARNPEGTRDLQRLGIVDKVKASYAFSKSEKFAFFVAHRDLCHIKATAHNAHAPMTRQFADILGVPASFARLFGRDTR